MARRRTAEIVSLDEHPNLPEILGVLAQLAHVSDADLPRLAKAWHNTVFLAEARARALPQARMMARLRSGKPLGAQETVEDAASTPLDGLTSQMADEMIDRWIVDEPQAAARRVRELATRHGVDEVMVVPVAASRADESLDATPGRTQTLELLADALA
jgi:hypothetical protein